MREPLDIPLDSIYRGFHDRYELLDNYTAVSTKSEQLKRDARQVLKPIVAQTYVSVISKFIFVMRKIYNGETVVVRELYKHQSRSSQVAIFLALL